MSSLVKASCLTLTGIMLIQFATGFTSDWGVISLYVLSYYYHEGAPLEVKASTNSLLMIIMVVPLTISLAAAAKLATCIGYVKLIRICAVGYILVPLLSMLNFSFILFTFCNLIAPACFFAVSLVPSLSCMYSHFPKSKSFATALMIGSFSIGAIVWNLIATMAINPDNTVPDVPTSDPNLVCFPREIALRVPRTLNFIYLASGVLFVGGSWMISMNLEYSDHATVVNARPAGNEENSNLPILPAYDVKLERVDPNKSLKQYMKHPIVVLLFLLNIFGCLFQIYVQLNTKLLYMPILQDDHLISMGLILIILSSAICSVPWGIFADKKGPFYVIILFLIIDTSAKIFATTVHSRTSFILSMVFLGSTDKTMLILFAPIIIDVFGLQVATELLPLKGISGIVSIILAAILGIAFSSMTPSTTMLSLAFFCILNIGLGGWLAKIISKYKHHSLEEGQKQMAPV